MKLEDLRNRLLKHREKWYVDKSPSWWMDNDIFRSRPPRFPEKRPFNKHQPWWPDNARNRRPPPWWPENEPFPPHRHGPKVVYSHFFHRLGCAVLGLIISVVLVVVAILGMIINTSGLIDPPISKIWLIVILVIAIAVFPWDIIFGGRSFRHFSVPMLDLFKASERVAEGDYDVRIEEQGTPEVRALVRAFNSMASRLKKADEKRRSLLADVTHELRTPLTVIRGNLEGIQDGVYEADEAHLKSIIDEVNILSRLVDDLRTLALAESGALLLHKEATDLTALIKEVVDAFQAQADEQGVELRTDTTLGSTHVYIDGERMHQVLSNLIVNALRYTPAGGVISLRCYHVKKKDNENRIIIAVEDNGPGIKAEDLPYVFERYYKASDSGGMGLGLSIVKNMVEAHGGKVDVESVEGKGTKFTICMPSPPI